MKILITGASGFIGKRIIKNHKENEYLVIGRKDISSEIKNGYQVSCGIEEASKWERTVKKFKADALINLAWQGLPDYSYEKSIINLNMQLEFIKRCHDSGINKLIIAGSCLEYGNTKGIAKECDYTTFQSGNIFGEVKKSLYNILKSYLETCDGTTYQWTRIFYCYGNGQRKSSIIPYIVDKLKQGSKVELRNPDASHDYIYIDDVADAIIQLSRLKDKSGIYNIGSGRLYTNTSIANIISETLVGKQMFDENKKPDQGMQASIEKIKQDCGWTPSTDIKTGITKYIQEQYY